MSKYETTHLSPSEIDRLRLQAFVTNSQDDMNAYYRAASLYFQERDVRAMNRADRIEELEAKLLESEALLAKAVKTLEFYGDERNYEGEYYADPCGCCGSWYEPKIHKDGQDSGDYARTTLAELTSSEDANGEAKGGKDE